MWALPKIAYTGTTIFEILILAHLKLFWNWCLNWCFGFWCPPPTQILPNPSNYQWKNIEKKYGSKSIYQCFKLIHVGHPFEEWGVSTTFPSTGFRDHRISGTKAHCSQPLSCGGTWSRENKGTLLGQCTSSQKKTESETHFNQIFWKKHSTPGGFNQVNPC